MAHYETGPSESLESRSSSVTLRLKVLCKPVCYTWTQPEQQAIVKYYRSKNALWIPAPWEAKGQHEPSVPRRRRVPLNVTAKLQPSPIWHTEEQL